MFSYKTIKFQVCILFFLHLVACVESTAQQNKDVAIEKQARAVSIYFNMCKQGTFHPDSLQIVFSLLDDAISLDSTYQRAYTTKSQILNEQDSLFESINVLSKGIMNIPEDPNLLLARGIVYDKLIQPDLAQKDYKQAIFLYDKITEEYPSNYSFLTNRAFTIMLAKGIEVGVKELETLRNNMSFTQMEKQQLETIIKLYKGQSKENIILNYQKRVVCK